MVGEKTEVVIIGGGVTGTGLARDLALRGVDCLLVEKGDLNSGASGANHGLLHSGARYVDALEMSAWYPEPGVFAAQLQEIGRAQA